MEMLRKYGIYANCIQSGLRQGVFDLLRRNSMERIYEHSLGVAEEAVRMARRFGENERKAETAALLHDAGAVVPREKRADFLTDHLVDVLPEEREFPLILHQKTSRIIAEHCFGIDDRDILDAVECHTTLRKHASKLDQIVFLADKIRWDQAGDPPYLEIVCGQLCVSLERGSLAFIEYLLENKSSLKVLHPWLMDAYHDLHGMIH